MQQHTLGGPPLDVVAAVSAVLSVVLGTAPGGFVIRSIAPVAPAPGGPSPWALAGRLEQQMARRQFGLRPR